MTDDSTNSPPRTRRSSFAGQTFADIFGTGRTSMSRNNGSENSPPSSYPGPITSAAAQAQRRRLSLTTFGLGSTNSTSPFGTYRGRNDSLGSADNSIDECAVEDDVGSKDGPTPSTPFARRVSFGARAMMDIKNGNGPSPNQQNASGEGFNWSDNLRTRAERTSNAGQSNTAPPVTHQRAKSVAVMEPPIRESPREQKRPDHFQERILKGDFYMD
ncbi:hypothetical protein AMS68_005442 [Peltaster fructicola]|uniref:Uncharacterized protein n=1 Tax=Peltaster fructicola TaxID=286661 RepID=A0A6H0XZ32_9PEZI|nr:hypothetical protein AMS68_005442 [Peltaster fructicola]